MVPDFVEPMRALSIDADLKIKKLLEEIEAHKNVEAIMKRSLESLKNEISAGETRISDLERDVKFSRSVQQDLRAKLDLYKDLYRDLIGQILEELRGRDA